MIRGSLTGRRFGMLTVEGVESQHPSGMSRYTCRCDCGRRVAVLATNLYNGQTGSCGDHRAHQAIIGDLATKYPGILGTRSVA